MADPDANTAKIVQETFVKEWPDILKLIEHLLDPASDTMKPPKPSCSVPPLCIEHSQDATVALITNLVR